MSTKKTSLFLSLLLASSAVFAMKPTPYVAFQKAIMAITPETRAIKKRVLDGGGSGFYFKPLKPISSLNMVALVKKRGQLDRVRVIYRLKSFEFDVPGVKPIEKQLYGGLQEVMGRPTRKAPPAPAEAKKVIPRRRQKKAPMLPPRKVFERQLADAFKKYQVPLIDQEKIRQWFDAQSRTFSIPRWQVFIEKEEYSLPEKVSVLRVDYEQERVRERFLKEAAEARKEKGLAREKREKQAYEDALAIMYSDDPLSIVYSQSYALGPVEGLIIRGLKGSGNISSIEFDILKKAPRNIDRIIVKTSGGEMFIFSPEGDLLRKIQQLYIAFLLGEFAKELGEVFKKLRIPSQTQQKIWDWYHSLSGTFQRPRWEVFMRGQYDEKLESHVRRVFRQWLEK